MKKVKNIALLICFAFVSLQNVNAQSEENKSKKVYKVQQSEIPDSVKETLKNYSGYTISKKITYSLSKKNASKKIYAFRIERKNFPYYLLVNEEGKVMGTRSGEGNQR